MRKHFYIKIIEERTKFGAQIEESYFDRLVHTSECTYRLFTPLHILTVLDSEEDAIEAAKAAMVNYIGQMDEVKQQGFEYTISNKAEVFIKTDSPGQRGDEHF